jgi:hypothetical protein
MINIAYRNVFAISEDAIGLNSGLCQQSELLTTGPHLIQNDNYTQK